MHEMSLMESVLEIACETALKAGASKVTTIRLDIGALSHVEPEALIFCYDATRQGTLAAEARLEINRSPGAGWCMDCERTVALAERFGACPDCGRFRVEMTSGEEMRISELEVV